MRGPKMTFKDILANIIFLPLLIGALYLGLEGFVWFTNQSWGYTVLAIVIGIVVGAVALHFLKEYAKDEFHYHLEPVFLKRVWILIKSLFVVIIGSIYAVILYSLMVLVVIALGWFVYH